MSDNSNSITITLSSEEVSRLRAQYTQYQGETLAQFAHRVFRIGLTQKEYRKDHNQKQQQWMKDYRAWKREQEQ